jgi:hypothetical protein
MKRLIVLSFLLLLPATVTAGFDSTFEDLGLPSGSHENNLGTFVSGGNAFNNDFNATFGSWSGWSISSETDNVNPDYTNQYSAITGGGSGPSATYGVGYAFSPGDAFIELKDGFDPLSIDLTNTTYAYFSMLDGDQFATKFKAGSFFQLTITGYTAAGAALGSTVAFDLARYITDFDHPLRDWATVDLSSLAGSKKLSFGLASSDVGAFGMNTPAYFAADNLRIRARSVPEPSSLVLGMIGVGIAAVAGRRSQMRRVGR